MSDNHLTEPLDYLYEELPPEGMAEARKHLAVCPDCRARVRDIRETVKRCRQAPRPVPPSGLAARAAAAAVAAAAADAAKTAAAPDRISGKGASGAAHSSGASGGGGSARAAPVVLATPEPARARIPAFDEADRRQAKLEEEFARLKQEVKEEMRRGWRQWFFHPAWTIAASALLLASLAIHFSPRGRYEQAVPVRGSVLSLFPSAGPARGIRNRERIPAPQALLAGAAAEAAAAPDQPVLSTPLPPAPAALREANARRDLPLPSLAQMRALPAAKARGTDAGHGAEAESVAVTDMADAAGTADAMEIAAAEVSPPVAVAAAPVVPAAPVVSASATAGETRAATGRSAAVAQAAPASAGAPELAAAGLPAAEPAAESVAAPAAEPVAEPVVLEELAEAAVAAEPVIDEPVVAFDAVAPAQGGEITPVLTPDELAALAAVDADAEEGSGTVVAMAEMDAPRVIARPEGFDAAERVRTLSALAGMQIASGEIADAWKTAAMLRRYSPAAAEEIGALIAEAEKAALAEKEAAPAPVVESDPVPEPPPAPVAVEETAPVAPEAAPVVEALPPFPGAMVEPPEDPPLSMVIVPAYMQPGRAAEESVISEPVVIEQDAALRDTLDPARTAELARALRQPAAAGAGAQGAAVYSEPLPVIPLQVFIQPVAPVVTASPVPVVSAPVAAPEPVPAPAPVVVPKKAKRKRFAVDPYLRDY